MTLLIVTQKIDAADRNLGFFIRWVEEFARFADVIVIANEMHTRPFPPNVRVHSLGKENKAGRFARFLLYRRLLATHLPHCDGIFFHMCPEYVLGSIGIQKPRKTALWYVHRAVSLRLRIAELLVGRIFTASKESFRLPSEKVAILGHGIDTALFRREWTPLPTPCLLTVGRISAVKNLRTLIDAFATLKARYPEASFTVRGEPVTISDSSYAQDLRARAPEGVRFESALFGETCKGPFNIFVHASGTGSIDKAVLEALASGFTVFTSSAAFSESIPGVIRFREEDPDDLANRIASAWENGKIVYNAEGREWVEQYHNLETLVQKLLAFYREP